MGYLESMPKYVTPAINSKSFSCPHCGALADQSWYQTYVRSTNDGAPPHVWDDGEVEHFEKIVSKQSTAEKDAWAKWRPDIERRMLGLPYLYPMDEAKHSRTELANIFVSMCYSCKEIAIWQHKDILYPGVRHEVEANADMDPDIRADFNEARAVFSISPRSSAALLRLCLQKLCRQLGLPAKNLNDDIGKLVEKGLPVAISQALDLVRVIGNNAVHPGQLDLKDDRSSAAKLFELVNLIADNQISQPQAIAKFFEDKVPASAKEAITRRDKKNAAPIEDDNDNA